MNDAEFGTQSAGQDWLDRVLAGAQKALLILAAAFLLAWCLWSADNWPQIVAWLR